MLTIGNTFRFLQEVTDYHAHIRRLASKPNLDVVFISNMRDEVDRQRYLGEWHPACGHFDGPRYRINGVAGRIRALDSIAQDFLGSEGKRRAREQFITAVEWAEAKGAKVVLLAASTKRLFGEDGRLPKEKFPKLLFTIGDNGTTLLLQNEVLRAFREAGLSPEKSRIGILGPYGLLGEQMIEALKAKGYTMIGAGPYVFGLDRIAGHYGIEVCQTINQMGKVDAIVACTHSEKIRLTASSIDHIRRNGRKLLVIDVAEPSNLIEEEYCKCRDRVVRQDAGNAYSDNLKNVLGPISYGMLRLTRGVIFGCFAEALCLAAALQRGEEVQKLDWFRVNGSNMKVVEELFIKDGFTIPSPSCFSRPVTSFSLEMDQA
jgi:hypothetical protein